MKHTNALMILAGSLLMFPALAFAQKQLEVIPSVPGGQPGYGGSPTSGYGPSTVDVKMNVNIADDVHTLKFVRDNTDPYTVTKAYEIKNADPYAVRGYLLNTVRAQSLVTSPVSVDALKFNDGSALVIVSAEEYRFKDNPNGEGFDTLVAKLDKKGLTYGGNTNAFIYFPRINSAEALKEMVKNVGASMAEDAEFNMGIDTLRVDSELNALIVSAPMWSWKNIMEMLKKYDNPAPEVRISYKVYEIYNENDDKIGIDFQSWKNNDGVDLFATGARVRRNWSTMFTGGPTHNGMNHTTYWDFNPKWNTRYVDLSAAAGHAKLLQSGMIVAQNREQSKLTINYGYFFDGNDVNAEFGDAATHPNPDVIPRQAITKIIPESVMQTIAPDMKYTGTYWRMLYNLPSDLSTQLQQYSTGLQYTDFAGNAQALIDYIMADAQKIANSGVIATYKKEATAYLTAAGKMEKLWEMYQAQPKNMALYQQFLTSVQEAQAAQQTYLAATGQTIIMEQLARVYDKVNYNTATAMPGLIHGKMQYPMPKNGFKFEMTVNPVVTQKATTLEFAFNGISMIGFNSDGTPRMSDSSTNTRVQLTHGAKEFVVDDIQKVEVVRGVAGLPWLKNIPVLGWLVGDENESTKKTRIIVALRAEYVKPADNMPVDVKKNIGKIIEDVEKGWASPINNMGFQQFLIDTNEWK